MQDRGAGRGDVGGARPGSGATGAGLEGWRIRAVDAARGTAILLMVAYHVFFDVRYFGIADVDLYGLPLTLLQYSAGILFVLIAGVSLTLSESRNSEGYVHHAKRGMRLAAVAVLITLATWIYPNDGFVQFGVIHLLALATFIAPLFFGLGRLSAVAGILVIAAGAWAGSVHPETHWLFWLGFTDEGYHALDHYPLLPWFGVVLLGMSVGQLLLPRGTAGREPALPGEAALALLGRNSLAIYLAHQPLIIAILLAGKALGLF